MAATTQERQPFADYAKSPEAHATALKDLLVSPKLYRHNRDHEREETDAMRLGRAVHTAVLEPDRFLLEYSIWTGGIRRGKAWDEFETANASRTILKPDQYATALEVRDAVRSHAVAGKLLGEQGKAELSVRWTHPRTGVKIKCRLDWLSGSALIDLKSARDVAPARFATAAAQLGYAMQLALYSDGAAEAGLGAAPVKIVAVCSSAPHDVVVYSLDEETLAIGRDQYERALDLLVECERTNSWPGMAPAEEVKLKLPAWSIPTDAEEELTFGGEALF